MSSAKKARCLARGVAYGLPSLLLIIALIGVDFWPFSAYRLFSSVRTPEISSTQLIAIFNDDSELAIQCVDHPVLHETMRFVPSLPDVDAQARDNMLNAWFTDCGIDRDDVDRIRMDKLAREINPETLTPSTTSVTTVWEMDV